MATTTEKELFYAFDPRRSTEANILDTEYDCGLCELQCSFMCNYLSDTSHEWQTQRWRWQEWRQATKQLDRSGGTG